MFVVWMSESFIWAGTFLPRPFRDSEPYFQRPLLQNWQRRKSKSVNDTFKMIDTLACSILGQLTKMFISAQV